MSLTILQSGMLSTIQDGGRQGYRNRGINPCGAMDQFASRFANILVSNQEGEAVLEMHFPAPKIRFEKTALVSLTGADFSPMTDAVPIEMFTPTVIDSGRILGFPERRHGARCYLAVQGGFELKPWLGSLSTHLIAGAGGFHGRALRKGDTLRLNTTVPMIRSGPSQRAARALYAKTCTRDFVRVVKGPEWDWMTADSQERLSSAQFAITSASNRTGYQMHGPALAKQTPQEMFSSGVAFGTVQLLPDGQLIILMADHPVTGGYPRIANVISADLPFLAQQNAPQSIKFEEVELEDAERACLRMEEEIAQLAS